MKLRQKVVLLKKLFNNLRVLIAASIFVFFLD